MFGFFLPSAWSSMTNQVYSGPGSRRCLCNQVRVSTDLGGYRVISNDAGRCKSFCCTLLLASSTLLRGRRNCVSFWTFCSCASPYVAQPFAFINLVLPTSHLFDHHRP